MKDGNGKVTRRKFLQGTMAASAAVAGLPYIVSSSVFGANAPSNRINLGCVGVGRMGLWDMKNFMGFDDMRVVAVCDVDSNRTEEA